MLEAYNAQFDTAFKDDRVGSPFQAPRPVGGRGSSAFARSGDPVVCPQPWRPSSPAIMKKKSRRALTTEDREREACQEIQHILMRSEQSTPVHSLLGASGFASAILPTASPAYEPMVAAHNDGFNDVEMSSAPLDMSALAHMIERPSANRNLFFNTPSLESAGDLLYDRTNSSSNIAPVSRAMDSLSIADHLSNSGLQADGDNHSELRLSLNRSPGLGDDSMGFEPAITPPIRSSNPITMNSPFIYGYGREGAEIGILSFSPPNSDVPSVLSSERRSRITSSPNTNDYYHKKRFGDVTTKHRPRNIGPSRVLDTTGAVDAPSL